MYHTQRYMNNGIMDAMLLTKQYYNNTNTFT